MPAWFFIGIVFIDDRLERICTMTTNWPVCIRHKRRQSASTGRD